MAAGYTTSLLANAQAMLNEKFRQPEFRHEPYNLIRAMVNDGRSIFRDGQIDQIMKSDSQTVDTFVSAKRSITAGSARAHNPSQAAFGDSQKVTLSFAIASAIYGISMKQGGRNVITQSEMLRDELESALISTDNVIEAAIAAYLSASKTQSNAASGAYAKFGTWNAIANAWEIPATEKEYFFQYISEIMAINDYDVPLNVVADPVAAALAGQLMKQGVANATNLGWQFENQTILKSRRVADSSYQGTVYVFPAGTVGLVNRIPTENREGRTTKDFDYSSMMDVFGTGLDYAVFGKEAGADNSTKGGETQDVDFTYENSTDYALVKAPLSAGATTTPIFKIVLTD